MKNILLIGLIGVKVCVAQQFSSSNEAYISNVNKGFDAMKSEQYDSCVHFYSSAFKITQTSYLSTLRMAACAYSTGSVEIYQAQLQKAFDLNWSGVKQIFEGNEEFNYLKGTGFEKDVNRNWEQYATDAGINLDLMKELTEIRNEDQELRAIIVEYGNTHGWDSPKMDSLWAIQTPIDQANMRRIAEIINEFGYPGNSLVGSAQSITAFLVIQHAELDDQEKYLSVLIEAANEGELQWSSVALLIDRVNIRNDRKQIYGSQVSRDEETGEYYFYPIEDPLKIDSLRATVGLGPIQEYADNWNFHWDPQKHLNRQNKKRSD